MWKYKTKKLKAATREVLHQKVFKQRSVTFSIIYHIEPSKHQWTRTEVLSRLSLIYATYLTVSYFPPNILLQEI